MTGQDGCVILHGASLHQESIKPLTVIGVILQLAYRLRRHFWLGWSLARWLGLVLVVAGLVALLRWWSRPWLAVLLAGVFVVYAAVLAWASRCRYVRFEASPSPPPLLRDAPAAPPLRAEEMVPLRASGGFTVEGQDQYYVDLEADFETVGTREHIVLARVHASRFLLLGRWPAYELGWWYIFFQPSMIREMTVGRLYFGPQSHLALRVVYAPQEDVHETIHLTFASASRLQQVWADLLRDAPAGVATPGS